MPGHPSSGATDEAAVAHVRSALADAAERLRAAGARTEALAEYVPARRVLFIPRPERLHRLGSVWRLGVLLLLTEPHRGTGVGSAPAAAADDLRLYATGILTRSHEPGRTTFIAASAERRRQLGVAAFRGHFAPGASVNFDANPIPLDASLVGASGPLTVQGGAAFVRWRPTDPDALTDFDAYLAERVALLVDPPDGA